MKESGIAQDNVWVGDEVLEILLEVDSWIEASVEVASSVEDEKPWLEEETAVSIVLEAVELSVDEDVVEVDEISDVSEIVGVDANSELVMIAEIDVICVAGEV